MSPQQDRQITTQHNMPYPYFHVRREQKWRQMLVFCTFKLLRQLLDVGKANNKEVRSCRILVLLRRVLLLNRTCMYRDAGGSARVPVQTLPEGSGLSGGLAATQQGSTPARHCWSFHL